MDFKTILDTLPSIDHLSGLTVLDNGTMVHHIPAVVGKLGSLRVYNALAQEFNGKLDRTSAQKGLQLFAEHTQDAAKIQESIPILICCCALLNKTCVIKLRQINGTAKTFSYSGQLF